MRATTHREVREKKCWQSLVWWDRLGCLVKTRMLLCWLYQTRWVSTTFWGTESESAEFPSCKEIRNRRGVGGWWCHILCLDNILHKCAVTHITLLAVCLCWPAFMNVPFRTPPKCLLHTCHNDITTYQIHMCRHMQELRAISWIKMSFTSTQTNHNAVNDFQHNHVHTFSESVMLM